jgi:hypothetical protein
MPPNQDQGSVMALECEMSTYEKILPTLLEKDAGRYVLILGEEVIGLYDTRLAALEAGYQRYLFEAFLAKRIVADEKPIFLPR